MPNAMVDELAAVDTLRRKQFTRSEVDAMESLGLFQGQRFELIQGDLIDKMGQNPPHSFTIQSCLALLARILGGGRVRVQLPVEVAAQDAERNFPKPDLAIVQRHKDDYFRRHPGGSELTLVVEVADTSLKTDLTIKCGLYARAGAPEYWVVDLTNPRLIVHRGLDAVQGKYSTVESYAQHESVTIEGHEVKVQDLLHLRDR